MAAERRTCTVRIFERTYGFASPDEETDRRIQEVARLVNEKMRQVRGDGATQTPMQTAVLTGLELVDELLRMQRDVSSVEDDISARTNRLTESLGQLFRDLEFEGTGSRLPAVEQVDPPTSGQTGGAGP